MRALSDPHTPEVVVMSSAQVGKTEILNNTVGFHIHLDPCPILVIQPTVDMGETWSKDRLTPMIRDTQVLSSLIKFRSRDSSNTVLHKSFPGGHVTIAGANSTPSLSSRPIRLAVMDEVDRYPENVGSEGDVVKLVGKRTNNFWNRKLLLVSTPTIKGVSRIEAAFNLSDKRYFFVPCHHCGEFQRLVWANVRWENHDPKTAAYVCSGCGTLWSDLDRRKAVRMGEWRATEVSTSGAAGFHISELYSPWVPLSRIVSEFLQVHNSPLKLRTWVNTTLGETWDTSEGESLDEDLLRARAQAQKDWGLNGVPVDCVLLTAGVDVQHDRLELTTMGHDREERIYILGHEVIWGAWNSDDTWAALDEMLRRTFPHELGGSIGVTSTCVDAGDGVSMEKVLDFCIPRMTRRKILPIKGANGNRVILERSKTAKSRPFYLLGVDTVKFQLYALSVKTSPERLLLSPSLPSHWFEQFASESLVTRMSKGQPVKGFERIPGRAAEALDCAVYAYAAKHFLLPRIDWDGLQERARHKEPPARSRFVRPAEDSWLGRPTDNWME